MSTTPRNDRDRRDRDTREPVEPGTTTDEEAEASLPPGAGTRGDPDDIPGTAGWGRPYEDAPPEGKHAPAADNPPPP